MNQKGLIVLIIPLLLAGVAIIVLLSLVFFKVIKNPLAPETGLISETDSVVLLKEDYKNPFDENTQYENPFDKYQNPFSSKEFNE